MALTPQFTFGNIKGVEQVTYTLSRGVAPSVAVVRMPLNIQGLDRKPNAMVFSDGMRTVRFSNCIISDVAPEVDGEGFQVMTVAIQDRRWQWKYGQISGRYNIRSGGFIQPATKKKPKALATLCFEAMGEKKFDVSRMPNDVYPFIDWNMDNPAAALEALCQSVNAHVCLGYDDIVYIFKDGEGKDMPALPNSSSGVGFDFGTLPGKVGCASSLASWQFDFPLYPVGLDVDGSIKLIDDLSYRPKDEFGGWRYVIPETMNGLQDNQETRVDERKLAKESVWRWYAVGLPLGLTIMPRSKEKLETIQQLFPLLDRQLEFEQLTDLQQVKLGSSAYDKDVRQRRPQQVWGQFAGEDGRAIDNVADLSVGNLTAHPDLSQKANLKLVYAKSFTIDQERRLVMFSDPVYRVFRPKDRPGSSNYYPPTLFLRTACNFYNLLTRAGYRLQKTVNVGGPNKDLIDWQSREDLTPEWYLTNRGEFNNESEVQEGLDFYLGRSLEKFRSRIPAHASYPYLLPYSPDGRIAQVTFEIDGEGFIGTTVNKEVEGLNTPVTYKERVAEVRRLQTERRLERMYQTQDPKKT